ncbi:MAG TPA: hypothetical protein VNY08_01180 [Bradyrhizobium sp.]|jgi:hypothetical protein|nr:hypothetical protein [Bradyrhizobium sp.]
MIGTVMHLVFVLRRSSPGKGQDNDPGSNAAANFVATGQRFHRALQWRKRNQNRRSLAGKTAFPQRLPAAAMVRQPSLPTADLIAH